jgi:hypothetical protein
MMVVVSRLVNQYLASAATLNEQAITSITPAFQSSARLRAISIGPIDHVEESHKSRNMMVD